ncbi:programmed cell death protein 2-like [Physella acuta]|uniref:programmed cell death protein 2-like n=1 Tax=Physella acuta TaxID=109671 RepID=UPI0027DB1405|nr:programmed cell death protein 2-like [Physella acuta]
MASTTQECCVKLGFAEDDQDPRLLCSHFFPSKIGGKPSWLSLSPLPEPDVLRCLKCNGMTIFLMQVYAPLQMRDDTFHRTLFLFVCPNASCCDAGNAANFKLFRSQLSLVNSFYSKDPPSEEISKEEDLNKFPHAGHYHTLCQVCGIKGNKKCSQCKKTYYCSKEHQVYDWKDGHKKSCSQDSQLEEKNVSSLLFKEFDLVTEDEEYTEGDSNNSKSDEERLLEYEQLMRSPQLQGLDEKYQAEDLEQSAKAETEDDKLFLKFKNRVDYEPTQVLRYSRGGEPLWVSAYNKPSPEDIPNCSCGAPRIFEFQVMPQLLNFLSVDRLDASLDWGIVCAYTCKDNCAISNSYKEEFVWKQDFHNTRL